MKSEIFKNLGRFKHIEISVLINWLLSMTLIISTLMFSSASASQVHTEMQTLAQPLQHPFSVKTP